MLTGWRKIEVLRLYRLHEDEPDVAKKLHDITGLTEETINKLIIEFDAHDLAQSIDLDHRGKGNYKRTV